MQSNSTFAEIKNKNSNQNGKLLSIKLNQKKEYDIKNRPYSHYNNIYNRRYLGYNNNNYNNNYNTGAIRERKLDDRNSY